MHIHKPSAFRSSRQVRNKRNLLQYIVRSCSLILVPLSDTRYAAPNKMSVPMVRRSKV